MEERKSVLRARFPGGVKVGVLAMTLLIAVLTSGAVFGTPATPVTVGAAAPFAVLAGVDSTASVTSTPDVIIYGNMGSGSTPVLPNFVCGSLFTQTPPPIPAALTNAYADATSVRGQINTPPQPTPRRAYLRSGRHYPRSWRLQLQHQCGHGGGDDPHL